MNLNISKFVRIYVHWNVTTLNIKHLLKNYMKKLYLLWINIVYDTHDQAHLLYPSLKFLEFPKIIFSH
jgi:hypothetical protein